LKLSVSMYENHRTCVRCDKKRIRFFFRRNIYVEMAEGAILKRESTFYWKCYQKFFIAANST